MKKKVLFTYKSLANGVPVETLVGEIIIRILHINTLATTGWSDVGAVNLEGAY